MRRNRWVVLAASLLLAVPVSAQETVLAWVDHNVGTSALPGALSKLATMRSGLTYFIAPDQATFNTMLSSGTWDLAVFGEQNTGVYGGSAGALTSYLSGGGKVLGTTWLDGSGFSTFMDATSRSSINGTSIAASAPMSDNGVGGSLALTNPGWGIFSSGWGFIGAGPCFATLDTGGCAALVGNSDNTMLLAPLFDTYANVGQGEQFVANGMDYLLGGPGVVPEPSSVILMASGLLGVGIAAIRRRRRTE